jgi:hypothetical protein
MSSPAEMAERHGRMLAELGELGLTLARDLQGRALAAETPAEAASLAEAFHRISRSVRQSLALEAKLQRDADRDQRERRQDEAREIEVRKTARKARLRREVERLIWDEVEATDVAGAMARDVPALVERLEAESEAFLDDSVEDQIARIREVLGVDEDWELDDEEADGPDDAEDAADKAAAPPKPPPDSSGSPYDYWYNNSA